KYSKAIKALSYTVLFTALGLLFFPWTQNIEANGKVTTLNPENRPQTINSRIAGRIEKWFVNEGDYVKQNDTIAFISEVKDEYFDPQLISRSESQIKAKESSIVSYEQKINAIDLQ
ncbi:MAG TPA: biotin/lipoyl-binding protein, partial [Bacteroidia bacterium]|nr:biotin/lipoyl-binding protein [Bacteroidia bacterium]